MWQRIGQQFLAVLLCESKGRTIHRGYNPPAIEFRVRNEMFPRRLRESISNLDGERSLGEVRKSIVLEGRRKALVGKLFLGWPEVVSKHRISFFELVH